LTILISDEHRQSDEDLLEESSGEFHEGLQEGGAYIRSMGKKGKHT
jgi:hypothetical protein